MASDDDEAASSSRLLLMFSLQGRAYGCDITPVREVVPYRSPTRIPGAPDHVCGLMNLRGSIVTVVDLGRRLGVSTEPRTSGSVILVESGSRIVGLAVDAMRDVRPFTGEPLLPPGSTAGGAVLGATQVDGRVVVLVDVEAVVRQVLL